MRYIKVLVLAVFLFLAFIFFFQNQTPLSQQMQMTLDLFFIPPMTSISLPFYFILIAAFLIGCLLTLAMLVWDKFIASSKLMKSKWEITRLQGQVKQLEKKLGDATEKLVQATTPETPPESAVKALPDASGIVDKKGKTSLKK